MRCRDDYQGINARVVSSLLLTSDWQAGVRRMADAKGQLSVHMYSCEFDAHDRLWNHPG